jgi:GGDEF domain-containing protein
VLEIRRILKSAYEDARFGVENKPYAKLQTIKMIAELFDEIDVNINSLKKVARISFDLNGLKAVNDLTGSHEQGDQYLKMMIDVLRDEKVTAWLAERKIEAVITADGGDEFGMILRSSEAIDDELVYNELISGIIKTELWNDEEAKNVLDFDKEEVLLAYAGINKNEWLIKTASEKNEVLLDVKRKIPATYFFRAAVSAGITTLFDSFMHAKIKDSDSYERLLEKAMGSLFDLSDKEMQADKTSFKTNLKNSQDICENFLLKVYSRTDSEKKLRDIIDRYERFLRDLKLFAPALEVPSLSKFIEDFEKNVNMD